jgi:glycosyltransferase involved in cell wall biosynthesis
LARAVRITEEFGLVAHVHNVHQRSSVFMGIADRVVAVSDAVRVDMKARGISGKKLRVVQNGTLGSIRLADPQTVVPRELKQPAIVSVAGLNHRKGIAELITAFDGVCRRVAHAQLYLVGSGPDRKEFEAQAAQSAFASQINFEGFQDRPDAYMKGANVFVLASRRDSFPLVIPEARQCGCAIVATDVDGIPEALDGGRAGVLVPPQNPEALADAITKLLENPEEAAQLRKRAGDQLGKFRVERVATELTSVYRELLGTRRGRVRPKSYSPMTAPANE